MDVDSSTRLLQSQKSRHSGSERPNNDSHSKTRIRVLTAIVIVIAILLFCAFMILWIFGAIFGDIRWYYTPRNSVRGTFCGKIGRYDQPAEPYLFSVYNVSTLLNWCVTKCPEPTANCICVDGDPFTAISEDQCRDNTSCFWIQSQEYVLNNSFCSPVDSATGNPTYFFKLKIQLFEGLSNWGFVLCLILGIILLTEVFFLINRQVVFITSPILSSILLLLLIGLSVVTFVYAIKYAIEHIGMNIMIFVLSIAFGAMGMYILMTWCRPRKHRTLFLVLLNYTTSLFKRNKLLMIPLMTTPFIIVAVTVGLLMATFTTLCLVYISKGKVIAFTLSFPSILSLVVMIIGVVWVVKTLQTFHEATIVRYFSQRIEADIHDNSPWLRTRNPLSIPFHHTPILSVKQGYFRCLGHHIRHNILSLISIGFQKSANIAFNILFGVLIMLLRKLSPNCRLPMGKMRQIWTVETIEWSLYGVGMLDMPLGESIQLAARVHRIQKNELKGIEAAFRATELVEEYLSIAVGGVVGLVVCISGGLKGGSDKALTQSVGWTIVAIGCIFGVIGSSVAAKGLRIAVNTVCLRVMAENSCIQAEEIQRPDTVQLLPNEKGWNGEYEASAESEVKANDPTDLISLPSINNSLKPDSTGSETVEDTIERIGKLVREAKLTQRRKKEGQPYQTQSSK